MNLLGFLAWIGVYLALIHGVARYRRTQAIALGEHARSEFRPEKDPGVRLAVFLVGILLCAVTYLALRALG